uniref:dUTP diphosphatase n=1 Tax=Sicyonia whispovirus TaxID=2984283 RepID=A0A9C7EZ63_9VIRU|nr:MAG: wsv112-like protein [Sicyonia whispovirus]
MEPLTVKYEKIRTLATIPRKASLGAAAYDVYAAEDVAIGASQITRVPTGLRVMVSPGHCAQLVSRSGLALWDNVFVLAGLIDSDYTGEVSVVLCNYGLSNYYIKAGDRIAQMVFARVLEPTFYEVKRDSEGTKTLDEIQQYLTKSQMKRGEGGFGSSGK